MKQPALLIVDDNDDSRLAIKAALRKNNYTFFEAKNAQEGILLANEKIPDLIVMDLMMPGMSGYEALQQLKAKDETRHIPVFIVTALGSMDEKITALEYGADELWSKPFDRVRFVEHVETLIGMRQVHVKTTTQIIEQKERIDKVLHRQSEELIHYYYTDALTGFSNRGQLIKDTNGIEQAALLLLDINGFKDIVYFYGHETGDACLKAFALKIKQIFNGDNFTFYRVSGDIFAVLIKDNDDMEMLEGLIKRLIEMIDLLYFDCNGHEIHIKITVGASMCKKELLISAEKALKRAKATGRTNLVFNEENTEFDSYEQNIFWANKIIEAIANDNITPFFQPIVNNKTNKIEKYECLVRMMDKDGTVHPPFRFLEISKKSKNYAAITKNVIKKAFKRFENSTHEFSVNLSAKDMVDEVMAKNIYEQLENFKGCNRVIFELLESEGIENYDAVYAFIKRVKEYGCQIAIDDFGSGYSNFIHLLRLKVDIIKIDGSLIRDLDKDENAKMIIETIVDFASKLNILTVAEFVHSELVHNTVKELGINYSQGYYIGEPKEDILEE